MTKRKKIIIGISVPILIFVLAFATLCFVTLGKFNAEYLGRVLTHADSSVSDYKFFPARTATKGNNPYVYETEINTSLGDLNISYLKGKNTVEKQLSKLINDTDTTAFLVVKNDKIVYEQYANGYGRASVNTSFSMAKSVVSLLIGKAIEDGYIESVKQPVSDFIKEFKGQKIGETTIEDLLLMRSDIEYDESKFLWFGDDTLTYWHPDLRSLALSHTKLTDEYQGKFHYNNYHPLYLGIILERSTGMTVSEYFSKVLWQPIGAENDASWSLDGKNSSFEKMESGINFNAVDFCKIGSMILHDGEWNGRQIISKEWLKTAIPHDHDFDGSEYNGSFLEGRGISYGYMWYAYFDGQTEPDIIAWGKSDQILFISPKNNAVILRTGKTDGGIKRWETVLRDIATAV